MRLIERTRETVHVHARTHARGAAGSMPEAFEAVGTPVRATLLDAGGAVEERGTGLHDAAKTRLLVPADAPGAVGDRVVARGRAYEICAEEKWTAHREWICKA